MQDGIPALMLQHTSSGSGQDDDYLEALILAQQGTSLATRYERSGMLGHLEEGIYALSTGCQFMPDDHPMKAASLNNLGNAFLSRFERVADVTDLENAITIHRQAVSLTPSHPSHLNSLGASLFTRFTHLGDVGDLDNAIAAQQQAVDLTLDGYPDKPACLTNLGLSLRRRFERLGDVTDVDNAIITQQQAISLIPHDHPDEPALLNNLGSSFRIRFERLSDIADVDNAVATQRQAVSLTADGHPKKPMYLNNLGLSFLRRFERLGDVADVDNAITAQQHAVSLVPDGHPIKPMYLSNLGTSFIRQFQHRDNIADVDNAIAIQQQAVGLTPAGRPDKPTRLGNLGISFSCRFERLGDLTDLDNAITTQQQAVGLTPDGHPNKPALLNSLGGSFTNRFERLGNVGDIDHAITTQQQAVSLTPDDHPNKPTLLNNLGKALLRRFRHLGDDTDFEEAKRAYMQSARSSSGPPSVRFTAAREWATLCFSTRSNKTIDAYSTLIGLLPHVVWLGRTVDQRYKQISSIGNAVTDAAAAAISSGEHNLALEWLEQGRSIVWGQILQLRTPLDDLRRRYPNEAEKLEKTSHALESAGTVDGRIHSKISQIDPSHSLEEATQAHRRLAQEYDRILQHIRSLPDFGEFLQPRKSTSLCGAAASGPIVVVNTHKDRCDALIILPHSSSAVSHVPLPGLKLSELSGMQFQLAGLMRGADITQRHFAHYHSEWTTEFSDILEWLWVHAVEPILSYLKVSLHHLCPCLFAINSHIVASKPHNI